MSTQGRNDDVITSASTMARAGSVFTWRESNRGIGRGKRQGEMRVTIL